MIDLRMARVQRCIVVNGSGPYAYYTGSSTDVNLDPNGLPEVRLRSQIRFDSDPDHIAGFHFKLVDGSDWIIVRGSTVQLTPSDKKELEEHLGLKPKTPALEEYEDE